MTHRLKIVRLVQEGRTLVYFSMVNSQFDVIFTFGTKLILCKMSMLCCQLKVRVGECIIVSVVIL